MYLNYDEATMSIDYAEIIEMELITGAEVNSELSEINDDDFDKCPICEDSLHGTYKINRYSKAGEDPRIYGVICSKCSYENYDYKGEKMKKSEGLYFGMVEDAKEPIFMPYDGGNKPNVLTVAEIGRGINFSHKSKMVRKAINLKYK